MNNLPEKILFYMKEKDVSYSRLSTLTGLSKSSLQRYATGTTSKIPIEAISKIEAALNLNKGTLMGWEKITPTHNYDEYGLIPIQKKNFPILGEIACGEPTFCNEDFDTFIEASSSIDADFCLIAKGDSMINARIYDGDVVFIKTQSSVDNGEIAAVIINDEATLKRVYYYPASNKLVLNAENPAYEPFIYVNEELEQIRILGKAVAFQSMVR